jgi:hypothetical protein
VVARRETPGAARLIQEQRADLGVVRAGTKDGDAKYKSRDPVTVIGWENEAREKGLTLADGFTIIYRFTEDVGADKGERTSCVRIDGDHGHPIIEHRPGLNTAFDTYVKKEVELAKGNPERQKEIADFLTRVGLSPGAYKLKVPIVPAKV